MTTETEERNPDNNPASTKRKESESQPGRPRRAGRGRRNSRSGGRRGGGGSSESAGEGKLGQRDGKSDSKSGNATKEGGSELGRRRRGQQGSSRSRRGGGKQDSPVEKQKKAMAPDSTYVEPAAVFIHQYTRIPSSRDYDTGMGQRPNWFVRWERDFDQGYEH